MARNRIDGPPPMPPPLPKNAAELAAGQQLLAQMRRLHAELQQKNLHAALALAQQAASGHGPLVEHFAEIGRRFGATLKAPKSRRTKLSVIDGGRT